MSARSKLGLILVFCWVVTGVLRAQGQPAESAAAPATQEALRAQPSTQATQPASAPAAKPNPLLTPYRTMQFFLQTVGRPEEGGQKYRDAMVCLDLRSLDAEELKLKGPEYVEQLAAVLTRLAQEGYFDPQDRELFPDEPKLEAGQLLSFGRDPLVLKLERVARALPDEAGGGERTVNEWRFSASTVAEIPKWYENLDRLLEEIAQAESRPAETGPAETVAGVPPAALQSPWHTVTFFLDKARDAQDDPKVYEALFACLDFSEAAAEALGQELNLKDAAAIDAALKQRGPAYLREFREKRGIEYVDGLAKVLQELLDRGLMKLDDLDKQPSPEHKGTYAFGAESLAGELIRQADGRWLFGRATVRRIPEMVAQLTKLARAAPAAEAGEVPGEATAGGPKEVGAAVAAVRPGRPGSQAPKEFRSARATLRTFRIAMRDRDLRTAVRCLDLSRLSAAERDFAGVLAGKLWLVMIRTERVPDAQVPDDPSGEAYELLARTAGRIELDRQWAPGRAGEWLFTSRTVHDIESLYEAFQRDPVHQDWEGQRLSFWVLPALYVREYVVPGALKRPWGPLQLWQWVGVLLVLALGLLVRVVSQVLLPRISRRLLETEGAAMLPRVLRKAMRPTSNLLMVAAWWGLVQFLDLGATIMSWIWPVLKVVMAVVAVLAFYRLVDVVMGYLIARASRTQSRLDDVLVPLLQKTLKVVIVAVGCVFVATAFGFEVTPLLAGLGVGGLAVSFAAKDTIANFFGSVNVVFDRPFQVGDWVRIGDVEGTVEAVGLRSSRIRTFYNSQVTVPNAELMTKVIDNMGRRRYRRIRCMISVTYSTTPAQLEAFCEGIRELVRRHPYTRKDYYHCYVNEFAASSVDILLYCFHEVPDWGTELRERQRLFVDIIRLANRLGVEFAFPTRTIHLAGDGAAAGQSDQAALQDQARAAASPARRAIVPADPGRAIAHGRDTAAAIAAEFQGDPNEKPPPVTF